MTDEDLVKLVASLRRLADARGLVSEAADAIELLVQDRARLAELLARTREHLVGPRKAARIADIERRIADSERG